MSRAKPPHNTRDVVIYADPPYSETKCYGKPFDNKKFWLWAEEMSRYNRVFVSEYKAPEGWECVLEFPTKSGMRDGDGNLRNIIEKLFEYRGE